jgi:uncharacterized protein (UPF0210 family)
MNVRSVTAFIDVTHPLEAGAIAAIGDVLRTAREALNEAGFAVQTTRLAAQPFPAALSEAGPGKVVDLAKDLEAIAFVHEIDYISLGVARMDDPPAFVEAIPDALGATENVFAGIEIANRDTGLRLPRIRRAAEVIRRVSVLTDDGFANLRLAALANVPAWSPFFPAAYHAGGPPRIAVATESADLALTAISGAASLADARSLLVQAIEREAARVEGIVRPVAERFDVHFQGIDFSLAPYPDEAHSVGATLEKLGLPGVGGQGTLAAAAFLAETLDRAQFTRTGFCGLMLPVLEDSTLAQAAADGLLRISDLLVFSAVCGTGLDTLPLAGDVSDEHLAAILVDVGALALRLDKPLTARLMPLPGKQAGDPTAFEFEYFANSRVLPTHGGPLGGLLAGNEDVPIHSLGER